MEVENCDEATIVDVATTLLTSSALLDGEMVVQDEATGLTDSRPFAAPSLADFTG